MSEGQPQAYDLLLYCRPGFEKETAAEIIKRCALVHITGYVNTTADSGYVTFIAHEPARLEGLFGCLRFDDLIFPRQWLLVEPEMQVLPVENRLGPIVAAARRLSDRYRAIVLESPDTNEGKSLSTFLRKFSPHLEKACRREGLMRETTGAALHVFFLDSQKAFVGKSSPDNASPWPMGIPRLRSPSGAPSRSTLKLDEAFLHFLGKDSPLLQPAMTAVDLGAAPGGWTWQLVRRSIRVTAVDNGPMDKNLLESGIVEHLRTDGFRYRPRKPVDWLVCDMIEQPSRIADLVGRWLAEGHCRHAIFNLKLPMKKRYEEVLRCADIIGDAMDAKDLGFSLRFKQLYHDREEVTGYCARHA